MRQIQILAPAKINLFLKIFNKRKDGYHDIETVFEKISLFDKVVLREIPGNQIIINTNSEDPCFLGKNNTIYRAILLVKHRFRIKKGISVYIEKNIPIGAGLGGGSSDAMATLKGLNKLWRLGLSEKKLLELSEEIGSDVPLFIIDGNFLLGKGRGEKLSIIPRTKKLRLWHVLVVPNFKIPTTYAYCLFDKHFLGKNRVFGGSNYPEKLRLTIPSYSANIITCALSKRDVALLNYYSYNSFKGLLLRKFTRLYRLNRILENISKDFVHLTGSGSALFMTFSKRKEAEHLVRKTKRAVRGCSVFLVSTL